MPATKLIPAKQQPIKLIQAMKQIKDLSKKSDDIHSKIVKYSADLDYETPTYPNTAKQIEEWLQADHDIQKEILKLRVAVQRTNLATDVTIQLNGKAVTKTIAEWIHRRRDLALREYDLYASLGRKESNLREGQITTSTGEKKDVKIRRHYDPTDRDKKMEEYRQEPSIIDANLEVVNAVTDVSFS